MLAPRAPLPTGLLRTQGDNVMWRQRANDIYDMLMIEKLGPPTACMDWLPWCSNDGANTHSSLLLGTNDAMKRNYLKVLRVCLPLAAATASSPPKPEKVTTQQRINHAGPVLHARHNPLKPHFVATGTVMGNVLVFNIQDSPLEPSPDGRCEPTAQLCGHTAACRSVAWSPHEPGILCSGSVDGSLCIWDIIDRNGADRKNKLISPGVTIKPLRTFEQAHAAGGAHSAAWHPDHEYIFASVGGDGRLCLWDSRVDGKSWADSVTACGVAKPVLATHAHNGGALALAFNPRVRTCLATGGKDRMVRTWDLRQPSQALQGFAGHHGDISAVDWARGDSELLASSSSDKRVLVWDPRRAGRKVDDAVVDRWHLCAPGKLEPKRSAAFRSLTHTQGQITNQLTDKYAPELAMVHGAHTAAVSALAWAPAQEGSLLASADADGFLHLWQPSKELLKESESLTGDFGAAGRSLWGTFNG